MRNILTKFENSFLELLDGKKVRETWYLWLPCPNISFIIIATYLIGKVSFRTLLEFSNQKQIVVFVLLIVFSIIKSYLISKYTAKINDKRFSVLSFICHLLPSFFLIWTFYLNWNTWNIIFLLCFDLSVSFLSNWLIERKVQAHILADIVSLFFFWGLTFFKVNIENGLTSVILAILVVTLRYLLITSFYNGIGIEDFLFGEQKSGKFYWFAELLSTSLFLAVLSAILEELLQEVSWVVILPGSFVYYTFLYLRLFLYRQFGVSYKELYYFVTMGGGILLYIWMINWVKIDIVVWFFPAVIILVLDDFIYLSYRKYTNRMLEMSMRGKQLFSKLKLFSLVSLFLYHILLENKQEVLCYKIFGLSLNQVDNFIIRDYMILPIFALMSSLFICTVVVFRIIDSLLQSHHHLIDRQRIKYQSNRRLHKNK